MIRVFCALIGVGFAGIGFLFVNYGLPRATVITCDRPALPRINCRQQDTTAWIPTRSIALEELQSVKVQAVEVSGVDASFTQYQIWLTGRKGTLIFGSASRPEDLQSTVTKLNRFREQSTPTSVTIGGSTRPWLHLILGSLAVGLGLWLAISAMLPGRQGRFITR